jgi:hypothetical protein
MNRYHKWVEWSEADQVYIGRCPDLITGIHGDNPVRLYAELCGTVSEVIEHFVANKRSPRRAESRCRKSYSLWRHSRH